MDKYEMDKKTRGNLILEHYKWLEYIDSKEWKSIRNRRIIIDESKCVLCKKNHRLNVHHLTYKRMYQEHLFDLITLCCNCHRAVHRWDPPKNTPCFVRGDFWDVILKLKDAYMVELMNYPHKEVTPRIITDSHIVKLMWRDEEFNQVWNDIHP